MIELPRNYLAPLTSANQSNKMIRLHAVPDEEKPLIAIERRGAPTRRGQSALKQKIERRVSSDRRKPTFSSKA